MAKRPSYRAFMKKCLKGKGGGVRTQRARMKKCAATWRKKARHKKGHAGGRYH